MTEDFRCAAASLERSEPLLATASIVRAFVLVEFRGAWGSAALRDARLGRALRERLLDVSRLGVKTLLIRRHGRAERSTGGHVFVAWCGADEAWLEATRLESLDDLLDLDLAAVSRGDRVGLTPCTEPIFCVCTQGRHDACCAERGRPLAAALTKVRPQLTWEVSHIGGDRFAGNVLVLPDGLYYGRVAPQDAAQLATAHLDGHLDLEHLRGRSSYPLAAQAAEHYARRRLGETRLDAVRLFDVRRQGEHWEVDLSIGGQTWRVAVHSHRAEPAQLTCDALRLNRAPVFEALDMTAVS